MRSPGQSTVVRRRCRQLRGWAGGWCCTQWRMRDYGTDEQGPEHWQLSLLAARLSYYTELVARALHRVEFRASQKGSQDKYLGVCAMALTVEKKAESSRSFRRDTSDTGLPEVQVALLSERINGLGEHLPHTSAIIPRGAGWSSS